MAMLFSRLAGAASMTRRGMVAATTPAKPWLSRTVHSTTAFTSSMPVAPAQQEQPTASPPSNRVYTSYYIYKGSSAVGMQLIPPTWSQRQDGSRVLERDGAMLLEFANANPAPAGPPPTAGGINRTYDWGNKVVFALTPNELGKILAEDWMVEDKANSGPGKLPGQGGPRLDLWHDPAKLGKAGEAKKKLSVSKMEKGNIAFSINSGSRKEDNIRVAVDNHEYEVFKTIARYAIPRLLGFNELFSS